MAPMTLSHHFRAHTKCLRSTVFGCDMIRVASRLLMVTLDEMLAAQRKVEDDRARKVAAAVKEEKKKTKKKKKAKITVSFDMEEEDEDGITSPPAGDKPAKKARLGKNPEVDTSFLPDREREAAERQRREELRKEWIETQERVKKEKIQVTFSYWDGSGNRRKIDVEKGYSIGQFLTACLQLLRKDFPELRGVNADNLIYVKEDLIIPHHHTFYEFIFHKTRGKSGPLFNFDVHDDVRLQHDATIEKDESHAGKVCLRSWYERNKHIYPATRWEAYDSTKDYGGYTISDALKDKDDKK
eukprot:TRINITY_DN12327_c1_g2_i8.p2 TRINITY_DN12327_c1_g2~~TRINITY_DN12327_c1_g2_i8.p2  ORF type:complete len:313 (+),score=71.28 TRINITY_DN12327_c1_g2_i8:48-941(+)